MQSTFLLLLCVASFAVALRPLEQLKNGQGKAAGDAEKWLLPDKVTPNVYTLKLDTHIENFDEEKNETFVFEGKVDITVTVSEDVDAIILHKASTLTILKATLKDSTPAETDLNFDTYDAETEKQTLSTGSKITAGDYTVSIEYSGIHKNDMSGFYRSYYTDDGDTKKKWLVTTQFESYNARAAYPCFDEPKYKATYDISITVNKALVDVQKYSALSNMPLVEGSPTLDGDLYTFQFKPSEKKISSYLVAFIVSDFEGTAPSKFEEGKKEFRTYGRKSYVDAHQGDLSQVAGPAALDVLAKNLQVPFAYPKMDQVGIPDFSAGAMENWGLVTYRERLIFYDEKIHPTSQKQSVVTVTTHEFGHQWFGDLVTLHWWSDIWLNEGFATFFEYHATAEIANDDLDTSSWKIVQQMVVDELQAGAFVTDGLVNSRPLTKEVYSPGEIDANFDNVAYSKGGSVIRMWMHILGKEPFYNALTSYLTDNQEGVGTPEKLLSKFDKVVTSADVNPSEDFKNWHTLAGYPVVNVSCQAEKCTLTQERYLFAGEDTTKPTWTIPISYTTSDAPNFEKTQPSTYLKKDPLEIPFKSDWIIFNIQQTGYYRVNYDEDRWNALIKVLHEDHEKIDEINRAQLIDDAFNLARAEKGYISYEVALNLTKYLVKERELIPWKAALNGFNFLYGKLAGDPNSEAKIKAHILEVVSARYNALPLETSSHTQKLLRSSITSWACKLGYGPCVSSAVGLFSAVSQEEIDPDVKTSTLCTAIREGTSEDWNKIWDLYESTTDNAVQTQLISAMGCSKDETILNGYLAKTLNSTSGIRKQDLASVFSAVYNGNPTNVAVAFKFLNDNLDAIAAEYGGILDPLGGLISGIAAKLGSEEDVNSMKALLEKIEASDNVLVHNAATGAKEAVDTVESNKAWLDLKQEEIVTWLTENYPEAVPDSSSTAGASIVALLLPVLAAYFLNH